MIRIFTTLVLLCALGYAQEEPDSTKQKGANTQPSSMLETRANLESLQKTSTFNPSGTVRTFDNREKKTDGSPYLFVDYRAATAVLVDGQILTGPARYNVYNNIVEFSHNGTPIKVLSGQIRAVKFDIGHEGVPLKFEQRQLSLGGIQPLPAFLYETLYEGDIILLKRYFKEFRKGAEAAMHHASITEDSYLDKPQYYFQAPGSEKFQIIKLKKGSILKALGGLEGKAKSYIKDQKLDCTKAGDVVRLLEYLETAK